MLMHIDPLDPTQSATEIRNFENQRLWTAAILKIKKGAIS